MKRRFIILALTTLAVVALISGVLMAPSPASAGNGATQIAGTGAFANVAGGECTAAPDGYDYYALKFDGYLNGCLYGRFVEGSDRCSPSGAYQERVDEIFVDDNGTFETTSVFTAKFELNEDGTCNFAKEIQGRCQHPLTGVGTGNYEGVTGRIDIKDIITEGGESNLVTFVYRGHLKGLP